ncbi:MAG: ATP-binding protein [Proteobacteria bacterium]|nr:ATP-binding protein [Pseudomonadota bacterium]MCP4920783.1 ATP-binding protein [Pseudomonadota bacterium]
MKRQPELPSWAQELRQRYLAGEASMFLLHGNVRDLFPWDGADGTRYVPLREFLERFLSRSKDIVAYYNCSEGIEFPEPEMESRFKKAVNLKLVAEGRSDLVQRFPKGAGEAIPMLESVFMDPAANAGIVVDYVETIVPAGDLSFMGDADKANLVNFQRWAADPALLASDNLVILVTESLNEVHRKVLASAQLVAINVPLPEQAERNHFVRRIDTRNVELEIPEEALSSHTAGLSLIQIRGIFRIARQSGQPITFKTVSRRKKAIIEQECHGLVEFVDPDHDFSHVGGMEGVKTDLMRMASAIKAGKKNQVPMGIIFVGPMGTGKTFLAEAFAGESGLTCLKFKNFRDKWVGSTEGNLEKILQVVDALGYVLLIIDEADRSMGNSGESDGGTGSRVIARLKEFMSDTSHRGRVVICMMTNRPDKLDTDLKRPGRFDVKIPFFFPEEKSERVLILKAQIRKKKFELAADCDLDPVAEATQGYSAAELEAVLLASAGFASAEDRDVISQADLVRAAEDTLPSRDTRMLEFMEMLAVFEASAKRMLPERYQEMEVDQVQERLDQLRALLGRRAL